MTAENAPPFSVIIPLANGKGRELNCIASWTSKQTFDRRRYEVILAAADPDCPLARQARPLLRPHDRIVVQPGSTADLYRAAAAQARGTVLVFTELHCLADAGCLAAFDAWFLAHPEAAAAVVNSREAGAGEVARLSRFLFAAQLAEARQPGSWRRLHIRGFAIRRSAYETTPGFEGELDLFADPVMAARLHRACCTIEFVDDAWVTHLNSYSRSRLHADGRDGVVGEHHFRLRGEASSWEGYFGRSLAWEAAVAARRQQGWRDAWSLACTMIRRPDHAAFLLRQLATQAVAALLGPGRHRLFHFLAMHGALARYVLAKRFSQGDARPLFVPYWRRFLTFELVRQVLQQPDIDAVAIPPGLHEADGIPLAAWSGVYDLERAAGPFRWTMPVFTLHCGGPSSGGGEVVLETTGMRRAPASALLGAFWNGTAVKVREDNNNVIFSVDSWNQRRPNRLFVVCEPLIPSRNGSGDTRRLGLPVRAVRFPADAPAAPATGARAA